MKFCYLSGWGWCYVWVENEINAYSAQLNAMLALAFFCGFTTFSVGVGGWVENRRLKLISARLELELAC